MSASTNVASLSFSASISRLEILLGKGRIVFVLSDKNCGERLKEKGRRRDSGRCKQNRQLLALTPTKILRWNFLGIHCSPLSHNCVLRRVNFRSTLANNGVVIDAIYIRLSFFTVHLAALIKTPCFVRRGRRR